MNALLRGLLDALAYLLATLLVGWIVAPRLEEL